MLLLFRGLSFQERVEDMVVDKETTDKTVISLLVDFD